MKQPLEIPALLEAEMLSPWFDASAARMEAVSPLQRGGSGQTERCRLLLILSPPRSGSYLLCRLLWHLGYGKPTEYFNTLHSRAWQRFHAGRRSPLHRARRSLRSMLEGILPARLLRRSGGIPDPDWLTQLVRERSQRSRLSGTCVFAAKIQAHQVGRFAESLRRDFAPMAGRGLWLPFDRQAPLLLMLFRRQWLKGMISFHYSLCSGCFDQGRIFTVQQHSLPALGNPEVMLNDLAAYRIHLEWLFEALQETPWPFHCLAFEDLLLHQETMLQRILSTIDRPDHLPDDRTLREWLNFRIAPDPSPWVEERTRWLHRLHGDFHAHGLHAHAHARRCSDLVAQLDRRSRNGFRINPSLPG